MARRAQSSISPVTLLIGLVLLAGAAIGGYMLLGRSGTPDVPPFNVADFKKNSLALVGNRYLLEGTVDRRDRVTSKGQIITVFSGAEGKSDPVPVLVPAGIQGDNIEAGYHFRAVVQIDKAGLPEVQSIVK